MNKLVRCLRYDWPLHFALLFTNWLPDNVVILRVRGALARPFLGSCGTDLQLGRHVTFYDPARIRIGSHVYFAYGTWIMGSGEINIGDEVMFGPYCIVVSSNHKRKNGSFRYGEPHFAPVNISSGCWLGSHVVVTAGCTIGKGTAVAAHAVVADSLPENVMAGGLPARVLRTLDPE